MELYKPQAFSLPFLMQERVAENMSLKEGKRRYNILYISAKPAPFSFDAEHRATVEFSKQKINYLIHKGHSVTGAYASTISSFTETWNAIGKDERLINIDKVIIDYHGAISPKRGHQSLIILSPADLFDKARIMALESKPSVKVVSLYCCYGAFTDNFNPAVGFLTRLPSPSAYTVGFDAQGENQMACLKTTRHYIAGEQFDNALKGLSVNRQQFGRVKYSRVTETEILLQHQGGDLKQALKKYI